jgi:antitoxin component YwqK of YwqJK toxin-antitoxin module
MVLTCSCEQPSTRMADMSDDAIPKKYVPQSNSSIAIRNDTVFLDGHVFSGYLYQLSTTMQDTLAWQGYLNGLQSGICKKWYLNHQLMEQRSYSKGQKNGLQTAWWENGNKRFEFVARNDAYEGELKEWDNTGRLFHLAHFVNGQEEGEQKLWYDNGKLRANYVIIQGKRYGLLGTRNCKNVSDSIFVVR